MDDVLEVHNPPQKSSKCRCGRLPEDTLNHLYQFIKCTLCIICNTVLCVLSVQELSEYDQPVQ